MIEIGKTALHGDSVVLVIAWHPLHPVLIVESKENEFYTVALSNLKPAKGEQYER